jgi:hypothetical protein
MIVAQPGGNDGEVKSIGGRQARQGSDKQLGTFPTLATWAGLKLPRANKPK